MIRRLNYPGLAHETMKLLGSASGAAGKSLNDPKLKALVELRCSQINGCAYCVNLHANQLRSLGEVQQRLDCLPAWRETTLYSAREMAALEWAEALTLIAGHGVPDDVYDDARTQLSDQELVDLTSAVAIINAFNRIAVSMSNAPDATT